MKYQYSLPSHAMWASFDYGQIDADSLEDAKIIAIERLRNDFNKANTALSFCDITKGFELSFNESEVQVYLPPF